MAAEFQSNPVTVVTSIEEPANNAATVTPDDNGALTPTRGLYVGHFGNIEVDMNISGTAVIFVNVPTGTVLPIRVTRVYSTNTTASNIVALW